MGGAEEWEEEEGKLFVGRRKRSSPARPTGFDQSPPAALCMLFQLICAVAAATQWRALKVQCCSYVIMVNWTDDRRKIVRAEEHTVPVGRYSTTRKSQFTRKINGFTRNYVILRHFTRNYVVLRVITRKKSKIKKLSST